MLFTHMSLAFKVNACFVQYITNFGDFLAPSPNYFNLALDVLYLVESGVRGIFQEGSYQSPGAEMNELKNYVLGRAMFNQTRNGTAEVLRFLKGYYGPGAAPHVLKYMTLLQQSAKNHSFNMQWAFSGRTASYLTPSTVLAAAESWNLARQTTATELHAEHVNRSAITMYGSDHLQVIGSGLLRGIHLTMCMLCVWVTPAATGCCYIDGKNCVCFRERVQHHGLWKLRWRVHSKHLHSVFR